MRLSTLISVFLLLLGHSLFAEEKMLTKEYSAEAVYNIPGMDVEDKHPERPYSKDSLKDPFEISLIKRLKSMSVTFPEGSSIKVHRKKETIEFVNTEKNHQRILYLVQNHEIYHKDLIIESRVRVYDISDMKSLKTINKNLSPGKIKSLDGVKEVKFFHLKSSNNKEAKLKIKNSELSISARVNSLKLNGEFAIKLSLDKGEEDKELFIQTTFKASMDDPQIFLFSNNKGEFKCAVFEFEFKGLNGQKLKALKIFEPKAINESSEVRLYKLPDVEGEPGWRFTWRYKKDYTRVPKKGWKWNPYIKTLAFRGTASQLAEADKKVSNFLQTTSNLYLSVKIIETKEKLNSDNSFKGVSLDEINRVPDSKKKLTFLLNTPLLNKKELEFNNDYKIIEGPDDEICKGTLFKAVIERLGTVFSHDFEIFKNLSDKSNEDEIGTETRYNCYSGKPLVLQLSGGHQENSRFLILEVKADD